MCTRMNVMSRITAAQHVEPYIRMERNYHFHHHHQGHLTTAAADAIITVRAREATECSDAHVSSSWWYTAVEGSSEGGLQLSCSCSTCTWNAKQCSSGISSIWQLWPVTVWQAKAGRYNQPNDTQWLEAVCAELEGSWWWEQECPKHVERNMNTIKF
jgi:hypothetical protein